MLPLRGARSDDVQDDDYDDYDDDQDDQDAGGQDTRTPRCFRSVVRNLIMIRVIRMMMVMVMITMMMTIVIIQNSDISNSNLNHFQS